MERIKLSGFAEACYDNNSIGELIAALMSAPDPSDLHEWGLSDEEYYAAIEQALAARLESCDERRELLAAQCGCGGLCDSKEPCPMAYNAKAAR